MKFKQALNTKISFFIIIGLMIGCGQTQNYVHVKNNLYVLPAVKDNSKESALESLLIGNKKGKPLIVFLTGSGNYPLVVHASDSNYYYLFDPGIVADTLKYNYLFVSKPHIPAVLEMNNIDPNSKYFNFNNDNELYAKFSRKNTIEYYKENLPQLIKNAKSQLSPDQVILMGHSQGARIVAEMAGSKVIDKFVYMSASPIGRLFYADVDSTTYKYILEDKLQKSELEQNFDQGDSYKTWKSFSYSPIVSISQTKKPFLIIYGEEDKSCIQCDLFYSLSWKNPKIFVKKYQGLNHIFYDSNKKSYWYKVSSDLDSWIKNN
ncbi:S9 family peptidase [Sphingobacterium sp. JUb56]|uniref:alpha/beta hydrolase family protein n=1 Tax=Sphingobacterium sp. JUb56 TaxID=2587145 RepID=UPI0016217BD9|nr:prolyl oligopeptidase family serine peptidase [Sphingobacterium sp. JUb56]MBB2951520.1 dienelactone hydrolase [Sphingobacterium sp. JUb56]